MTKKPTVRQIAAALGISHPRVVALSKEGMPTDSIEAAAAWREAHTNPAARAGQMMKVSDLPDEDFQTARTRREIADANLAELKEAEQRGELIRVEAVRSALASLISTTREGILQVPARMAPVLAVEADPGAVHDLLMSELNQVLSRLASAPAKILGASA